ncbi:DUF397 domain-containing protein [Nocardia sp. CA-128927]|uniref:DUF397 domain-containing protein n=1 Tax=Nocardia sp. CA-128927 TaxID=3239975 RepID=UPI003D95C056
MNIDITHARWFKSARCFSSRDCVEVAHLDSGQVGIRDSKNRTGPALVLTPDAWDTFIASVVHGDFNHP